MRYIDSKLVSSLTTEENKLINKNRNMSKYYDNSKRNKKYKDTTNDDNKVDLSSSQDEDSELDDVKPTITSTAMMKASATKGIKSNPNQKAAHGGRRMTKDIDFGKTEGLAAYSSNMNSNKSSNRKVNDTTAYLDNPQNHSKLSQKNDELKLASPR
jgi:hypothetical protein